MSVVAVNKISEESGTSDGTATAIEVYVVKTNSNTDTTETALAAEDIPSIGDTFGTSDTNKCVGRRARRRDDEQFFYEVECRYSSRTEDVDASIEDPLARPTRYSYGGSNISEPFFRDAEDKPVVNSAGDDYADLPQRQKAIGTMTVSRNESSYNDVTAEGYKNTVNSGGVTINGVTYAAGTLRMDNISADGPQVENGVTFYAVSYSIAKKIDGWDLLIEDRGLNELDANGKLSPIMDAGKAADTAAEPPTEAVDPAPVRLPYPMDGVGKAKPNPTDTPETLTFKPYLAASWSGLSFS